MHIINRSPIKIDKEVMRLIARQNGAFSPTVMIFLWDAEKHGKSSGEYCPCGFVKKGRKVKNTHGEIRLYLRETDSPNMILWYFAHEYRHCMQELTPCLSQTVYNTDREKLIKLISNGSPMDHKTYWEWHDLLPEEIDADCFASLMSGYCRLGANVFPVSQPSFPNEF